MMEIEIVLCSIGQMEKSIEGADAFENADGLQAIPQSGGFANDGYLPFSARVLAKYGMTKASETIDPNLGCLCKWEVGR
jgi:hypothetical protein